MTTVIFIMSFYVFTAAILMAVVYKTDSLEEELPFKPLDSKLINYLSKNKGQFIFTTNNVLLLSKEISENPKDVSFGLMRLLLQKRLVRENENEKVILKLNKNKKYEKTVDLKKIERALSVDEKNMLLLKKGEVPSETGGTVYVEEMYDYKDNIYLHKTSYINKFDEIIVLRRYVKRWK